ncbi:TIM44-related membrane protein TimA [Caulobacter sp. S45]|jgi:predicted lipid-binding transport protein (Tim44 family)|uniref:TIM44-related membrane protein TimA n=1 Tax=Caulobacter sp. S45 TaxID=1641861 RepID=UPI00131C62C7|nr:TIM44-related membrane protein TimA [Caulobacter sp. S45]
MQVVELLIFAVLAAVVLFQLYSVLGRRMGRQPEDAAKGGPLRPAAERLSARPEPSALPAPGLAGLKARDPSFDPQRFLQGARTAYEQIVKAYASGDRDLLKRLTSSTVYKVFENALIVRDAANRTEQVEFLQPTRADLDDASVAGDTARVRVRFLSELRNRTKDARGEAVDDRRTAELWTFERLVASRDPNWTLARVEAAEA